MIAASVKLDMKPARGLLREGGLMRAMRIGVSRAASPVKASVVSHANAVKRYGFLAKSIRIRLRTYPNEKFVAVIGPSKSYVRTKGKFRRGKRKGQARKFIPAKVAHLVEKGTKRSKAKPFLAPAHAETAQAFLKNVGVEIGREIEQQLARQGG